MGMDKERNEIFEKYYTKNRDKIFKNEEIRNMLNIDQL